MPGEAVSEAAGRVAGRRKGLVEEEALSDFRAEVQKQKPVLAGMADRRM